MLAPVVLIAISKVIALEYLLSSIFGIVLNRSSLGESYSKDNVSQSAQGVSN